MLLTAGYFYGMPVLARFYWPSILTYMKDNDISYNSFFLFWSLAQHNLLQTFWNLVYFVFYRYEFPFIEKYKTNF